jgi:hypothetical protein
MVFRKEEFLAATQDWAVPQKFAPIWANFAARLDEEPDEGDVFLCKPRPRSMSEYGRLWDRYVEDAKASFAKRADVLDDYGRPRVSYMFRANGLKRYADLMDHVGRHRARLIYDSNSAVTEVVLKDVMGRETVYSKSDFDPNHDSANLVESLVEKLERALGSNVASYADSSAKQQKLAEQSVLDFARDLLALLEKVQEAEELSGKELLPAPSTLSSMGIERVVEHLDKLDLK